MSVSHLCPLCNHLLGEKGPSYPVPFREYEGLPWKVGEVIERLQIFGEWAAKAPKALAMDPPPGEVFEADTKARLQKQEKERLLAAFAEERVPLSLEEYREYKPRLEGEMGLPDISERTFSAYSSGRELSLLVRREKEGEGEYSILLGLSFSVAARFAACNPCLFFQEVRFKEESRRVYVQIHPHAI